MDLKNEQRRLYDLLETRCFVRLCDDDSALWVSDLPRKQPDCDAVVKRLESEGFSVRLNPENRLLYADWTEERWQEMLQALPDELPSLPEQDPYHEAYALCRLWLTHPTPLEQAHLPALRRVIKLTVHPPQKLLRTVKILHEEAAVQLRCGQNIAYDAGRLLASWLKEYAS